MSTVLLVRHGRTTANASGTLAGWTPGVGLDDLGWEQARDVGRRMVAAAVRPARIVCSPLQRTRETAAALLEAFGEGHGISVEADERLGECRYGAWTGRSLAELAQEPLWRVVQEHPSAATFPDGQDATAGMPGESIAAMSARAVAAVRQLDGAVEEAAGPGAIWVAVSHGDVIKAILADAAGMHLDHFQRLVADPASVSIVRYTRRRPFVVRINDIGGSLAGLVPPSRPEPGDDGPDPGDGAVGGGAGAAERLGPPPDAPPDAQPDPPPDPQPDPPRPAG